MRRTLLRMLAALILLGSVFGTSCITRNRVIYVRDGDIVRLRQDVKAKVWVMGEDGKWAPSTMTLPNGWFCGNLDKE